MLQEHDNLVREIRNLRDKDNIHVIKKCFIYLSKLHSIKNINIDITEDLLFVYHDLGRAYKKLNKIQEAIKYELNALNYVSPEDYRYYSVIWQLSECYGITGNLEKALDYNYKCLRYYRKKDDQFRICVLFNRAKLLNDTAAMLKIIHIYENNKLVSKYETFGGLDSALLDMYTELQNLFIVKGRNEDYLKILYNIKNKEIKKELYRRYKNKVA